MASEESRALFQRLVDGMAASVRRQMAADGRGEKLRNSALVVLGLLAVWASIRWATGPNSAVRRAMDSPRTQTTTPDPGAGRLPPPGIESPETFGQIPSATMLRTRASIDEGTARAAKARQRQFLYTVEDVVQVIADADAKRKSFEVMVQGFMTTDAGKKIAATQRGVPRFIAIVDPVRTSAARLAELSGLVETIAEPVRKAHADNLNHAVPVGEQERMLAELRSEAERARSQYGEALDDLASLARQAEQPGEGANGIIYPAPADKPLKDAVEEYRLGIRGAAIEERERRLDAEREEDERRLTQAAVELERAKGKAEEDRLKREARELEAKQREAGLAMRAEAERRRLLARAREPRVRQMLEPFLKPGFMQPKEVQGTFLVFERTKDEKPMSLTALRAVGALEPTPKGLGQLAWVAADAKDDRPRWAFGHSNTWSKETQRYVSSVQELLLELGEVLVEEGMLSR
jgi:hypothetical protein